MRRALLLSALRLALVATATRPTAAESAAELVQQAERAFADKDFLKAAGLYELAWVADVENLEAVARAAQACEKAGNADAAIRAYRAFLVGYGDRCKETEPDVAAKKLCRTAEKRVKSLGERSPRGAARAGTRRGPRARHQGIHRSSPDLARAIRHPGRSGAEPVEPGENDRKRVASWARPLEGGGSVRILLSRYSLIADQTARQDVEHRLGRMVTLGAKVTEITTLTIDGEDAVSAGWVRGDKDPQAGRRGWIYAWRSGHVTYALMGEVDDEAGQDALRADLEQVVAKLKTWHAVRR